MASDLPLVSIVTPAFNSERTIARTIDSVQAQDYGHIQHIVVDGGSTDGTLAVLQRYGDLKWISEPDQGQSDAINKGFKLAQGEILAWINADDTYNPGAVSTAVHWLRDHPDVDLVHSDYYIIDEADRRLSSVHAIDFELDQLFLTNEVPGQFTAFWKRRVLERVGLLNTALHYMMDYDYWIRIASGGRIKHLQGKFLANFRLCPGTKTYSHPEAFRSEADDILRRATSSAEFEMLPPKVRRRAYASALRHRGIIAAYQNDAGASASLFREAGEVWPQLRQRDVDVIVGGLGECARSPLVSNALAVIQELFWQPLPANIARLRRPVLGRIHHTYALDKFQCGDWGAARPHMIRSFYLLPSLMRSRGMWSVFVQCWLGPKSNWLRAHADPGIEGRPRGQGSSEIVS